MNIESKRLRREPEEVMAQHRYRTGRQSGDYQCR
jgi:hypothetical protein